jgi:hypothetical protein
MQLVCAVRFRDPGGRRALDRVLKECEHQVEPDPAEMATRYGAENAGARLARALGVLHARRGVEVGT